MARNLKEFASGLEELRAARRQSRAFYWIVAFFSTITNLLMFSGPIYMLQIYDRVLMSRSIETLVVLTGLVVFLLLIMGVLDYVRGRILARIAEKFYEQLEKRVFDALLTPPSRFASHRTQWGLSDLETLKRFTASPGPLAAFDMPWTPIFLLGLFVFHPWLGHVALLGTILLIFAAILNQHLSQNPRQKAHQLAHQGSGLRNMLGRDPNSFQGLGIQGSGFERLQRNIRNLHAHHLQGSDITGGFSAAIKTLRLLLQSAMLATGAHLVVRSELSLGAVLASSILASRAVAPIEIAISQWSNFQNARKSWWNLAALLTQAPRIAQPIELPKPKARLDVKALSVAPNLNDRVVLKNVHFNLQPGEALGVIGPSASGKSTLARALVTAVPITSGKIELSQASIDQYPIAQLAKYIGYLPQHVELFEATIAENIAGLSSEPDSEKVVQAAKWAEAHELILSLPKGYDTVFNNANELLSAGQLQRIALARALYSDPVILVLDEPSSHLDSSGAAALNRSIKRMKTAKKSVIIMSQRPDAIRECENVLVLKNGRVDAFGARDRVLRKAVSNHRGIEQALETARTQMGMQ
ncbi:type I secretion system permease/ATPase [Cognatishimia activa]|uniref:Type I secretion system ATP-binding protein PrsD n=1 Tax=Cognatishimia activa TaxID=1715691 RepID=A0A0P1IM63_9RHOB|nr:type I secretion system permease/ATPase [Cognatishimia activa]CUI35991.1 Type I secretion system ATP-binding protein PrsD [Cognatishimia activa]CUK24727.1 Type I secretion system ATP-binding protein PrsD [Cognatishimia activa]